MPVVTRLLEELDRQIRRTAENADTEAVHDLRICTRRAVQALRLFAKDAKRLRRDLGRLRKQAAAVRDRDVTMSLLRRLGMPPSDPALIYLRAQRDLAADYLKQYLRREVDGARSPRWRPLPGKATVTLQPLLEEFLAAGKRAADHTDSEQLHQFRIAVKRLRYTLELVAPEGAEPWLRRLRQVQTQLGEMNDATVAADFLQRLPVYSPRANRMGQKLRTHAQKQIALFQSAWRRHFGGRAEAAWVTWVQSISQ